MTDDLQELERAAREALAECYGRPLSDEEWASAKAELVALARVLRDDYQAHNQHDRAA